MHELRLVFKFILILFLGNGSSIGQSTKFNEGFKAGFLSGYCYSTKESSVYCNPPLVPMPPLPKYLEGEKDENFQDGYNRGFILGVQRRRNVDYGKPFSGEVTPPKFNPYIPQNPIVYLSHQERAAIMEAKAARGQQLADALGYLLANAFTVSSEERAARLAQKSANKAIRIQDRESKRLIIGSPDYLKTNKQRNKLLLGTAGTAAIGGVSFAIASRLEKKYPNATTNAQSIRKSANALYATSTIATAMISVGIVAVLKKSVRIWKARKPINVN